MRSFARTGDDGAARKGVGGWARGTGGGRIAATKSARAAAVGGAAIGGLSRAATGQPPIGGRLDIRLLAGRPVAEAIEIILDAFATPGVLDEVEVRVALGSALAAEFAEGIFDPAALTTENLQELALTYVEQLVLQQILSDLGNSFTGLSPRQEVERENRIASLVRGVIDARGRPILANNSRLDEAAVQSAIAQVARVTIDEMATW